MPISGPASQGQDWKPKTPAYPPGFFFLGRFVAASRFTQNHQGLIVEPMLGMAICDAGFAETQLKRTGQNLTLVSSLQRQPV